MLTKLTAMHSSFKTNQTQAILEVLVLSICLLAAVIFCYDYFSLESMEDAKASFARSLEAWDRQIASSGR